jgi:hypothetical protein
MQKFLAIKLCAIIVILASICFSQQGSAITGESVVGKAREAAGISSSMVLFRIKLHRVLQLNTDDLASANIKAKEMILDNQDEVTVLSPDKLCSIFTSKISLFDGSNTTTNVWNNKKFKQTMESEFNGIRTVRDTTEGISIGSLDGLLSKTNSKKIDVKPNDPKVALSNDLWMSVFPFTLKHPIEDQVKFEFIGRAKAGEQTANFVQVKSVGGHLFQLFFDEKTNNLLLMIEKFKESEKVFETKYYYSNREKRDNILIPTKIKVERKITDTGQTPKTVYEYIEVVGFEVNPEIKKDLFEIK